MPAFRCTRCEINWPVSEHYQPCAGCGQRVPTDWIASPLEEDDALSRWKWLRFDAFYREWDLARFREQLDAL